MSQSEEDRCEIEIRHRLAMARRKIREKIREKRKTPALQF